MEHFPSEQSMDFYYKQEYSGVPPVSSSVESRLDELYEELQEVRVGMVDRLVRMSIPEFQRYVEKKPNADLFLYGLFREHRALSKDKIQVVLNGEHMSSSLAIALLQQKNLTKAQFQKLVKHPNLTTEHMRDIFLSDVLTSAQISRIIVDPHWSSSQKVFQYILAYCSITLQTFHLLQQSHFFKEESLFELLFNPHLSEEVLQQMLYMNPHDLSFYEIIRTHPKSNLSIQTLAMLRMNILKKVAEISSHLGTHLPSIWSHPEIS